jgi:CRISPR-associated protein Csb1
MLDKLKDAKRLLLEADLAPVQGDRFQPTGFADLGAATYQAPDGTRMLLVESAQSVANRLEATIIGPDNEIASELAGLSYIQAQLVGASDTRVNSLVEAHRVNSPFIISDKGFQETFVSEAEYGKGKPLNWQKIAGALFKYDANSVLHGTFLANLEDGRIKMARAISGFIEARGVREAVSGGVKNNPIDPSGKIRAKGYDKDVYSNVPFQRVEYTAEKITAYFNMDLGLLHSYDLGNDAFDLLIGLGLLKIRRFLDGGLRLRTACDFRVAGEVRVTEPEGFKLTTEGSLLELVKSKIQACKGQFASPSVTLIDTEVVVKAGGSDEIGG